jgi:uncharacterized membrane protein YeaQ/YmgE (transglycosylase-associated protein family)
MGILSWIIFGGLAGWIASMLTGRNRQMGLIANIVAGILGAVVGGWIMSALGGTGVTGFNLQSFLVAVLGAVVVLIVAGFLTRRR